MSKDKLVIRNACDHLERVNILRKISEQNTFVVQESNKVVSFGGVEQAGIQLLREGEEGIRIFSEEIDLKNRFGEGKIVLLKVGVKTRA